MKDKINEHIKKDDPVFPRRSSNGNNAKVNDNTVNIPMEYLNSLADFPGKVGYVIQQFKNNPEKGLLCKNCIRQYSEDQGKEITRKALSLMNNQNRFV